MQITNSLDIKTLRYENLKLHKRRIAGRTVHLISRTAYRKLTRGRFAAKLGKWAHGIRRNITEFVNRRRIK